MPRQLIGLQFILTLALAAAVSGCSGSNTASDGGANKGSDDRAMFEVRLRDIGGFYDSYLRGRRKPPSRPEDLEDLVDPPGWKRFLRELKDGSITVIWNAEPRNQEGNADKYILAYETKPGPSGKRWVYLAKRGGTDVWDSNRWMPHLSSTVELTAEEFEKAAKAKPSP